MKTEKDITTDWPTPQDYNEAVQSPRACFHDEDLKESQIAVNALGLPHAATGAFASVYKATTSSKSWAVRCFLNNRPEQGARYKHISDFVLFDNLDSTVDFYYLDQGIRVKGVWYPCLKMTWVEGITLDRYIEKSLQDSTSMSNLLKSFHQLVGELEGAGIGHGDLQHGNILVTEHGLRLVDYDALFVPALNGLKCLEFGHPNYQHPERSEEQYDPDVDNFSCWLIHTSLLAIAIDPTLYKRFNGGDECLLFRRSDLNAPEQSRLFSELLAHDSEQIREAALVLKRMLWSPPDSIPYLGAPAEALARLATEPPTKKQLPPNKQLPSAPRSHADIALPEHIETVPQPDFSSMYVAIDDYVGEKKRDKRKPSTQFKKLTESTFNAGRQARNRIHKMAETFERTTLPEGWTSRKLKDAEKLFYKGSYDEASKIYRDVYKHLDQKRHSRAVSDVASSLGYCYAMEGNNSLACNWFLASLNQCRQAYEKAPLKSKYFGDEVRGAALLLAICKYDDGNESSAWKTLDDNQKFLVDLSALILAQQYNDYVFKWSAYSLLRGYALQLAVKDLATRSGLISDLIESAAIIFMDLLQRKREECTEEMIRGFMQLLSLISKIDDLRKTKTSTASSYFSALAVRCEEGFENEARVARFCVAVSEFSKESASRNALTTLSGLGSTNVEQLFTLATAASAYVDPANIMTLLIAVRHSFNAIGSKVEALDALRVACRFAPHADSKVGKLVSVVLEMVDEEAIELCLNESFLAEDCNAQKREEFIVGLAEQSRVKILSLVVARLLANGELDAATKLFELLSTQLDAASLNRVLLDGARTGAKKNARATETLDGVCEHLEQRCILNLDGYSAGIHNLTTNDWTYLFKQLSMLDNLRHYYHATDRSEKAEKLLLKVASEDYKALVTSWFGHLVASSNYDRYYSFALELARGKHIDAIERIITAQSRERQVLVIDGLLKNLTAAQHFDVVLDLCRRFALHSDLPTFSHVSREVVRSAENTVLFAFLEELLQMKDGNVFVSTIVTHLIRLEMVKKAAQTLVFLNGKNGLSSVSSVLTELLDASYFNSVFCELLKESQDETLAALTTRVAADHEVQGLMKLFKVFREGAASNHVLKIFQESLSVCCKTLDLCLVPALASDDFSNDDVQSVLDELDTTMRALHTYRRYVVLKKDPYMPQNLDEIVADQLSRTLSDKYDGLIGVWTVRLAARKSVWLLNTVAVELAQHKKTQALNLMVYNLTRQGQQDFLFEIADCLLVNGHVDASLEIAFQLAKHHTFEAKTIMSKIMQHMNHESALFHLINRSAEINDKLADMIVRQIASSERAEVLKPMAFQLAQQGRSKALYLVLTQLLSVDEHFLPFVAELCDTTEEPLQIRAVAAWLTEMGMTKIIKTHLTKLEAKGNEEDAVIWREYLNSEPPE